MGEAKRRGTFEDRKRTAIERDQRLEAARAEVRSRRPSPKHAAMLATLFGIGAIAMYDPRPPRKESDQ